MAPVRETGPLDAPMTLTLRVDGPCAFDEVRRCLGPVVAAHDHLTVNAKIGRSWRTTTTSWGELEELWNDQRVASFVSSDQSGSSPYETASFGTMASPMRLGVGFRSPTWSSHIFETIQDLVVDAANSLGAVGGFVGYRDGLRVAFNSLFGVVMAADPIETLRGYDWIQIVPSETAAAPTEHLAVETVGNGELAILRLGPTPIQSIEHRDQLRDVVDQLLATRGAPSSEAPPSPEWIRRCLLASADDGLPLGDEYSAFTQPWE